jgi:DNA (cytosine-5)-methyltransferase 1
LSRTYRIADLFCGAGGSSTGAIRAIESLGGNVELVAVNHWHTAIATHSRNHPHARHYCVNLDAARPEDLVPEGSLDLLMASPECTFFSRARGGKPISDQQRMSAWHVQRWASTLDITRILVENVPEFVTWGPVDTQTGKPIQERKGSYFIAWINALVGMGYAVDYRLINAADYGGATTRTRFFLQARKDDKPIRWPEPTHSQTGSSDMFGELKKWRAAREIIDWHNPGGSLLGRKRPLSLKTRLRIARGLRRFGGTLAPLYIRLLDLPAEDEAAFLGSEAGGQVGAFTFANRNNNVPKSLDEPVPTATTSTGGGVGIVTPTAEPFVMSRFSNETSKSTDAPLPTVVGRGAGYLVAPIAEPFVLGQQSGSVPRSTDDPLSTVATDGAIALVEPTAEAFVIGQHGNAVPKSVDEPIPTVCTIARISLIQPMLTSYYGASEDAQSVESPVPTITTHARHGLCSPLIVPYGPSTEARSADEPLPTILTKDRLGVCEPVAEPFIMGKQSSPSYRPVTEPIPTITTEAASYLVSPFIVPQFGEAEGQRPRVHDVEDPLPAVTSHGAGALVEPTVVQIDHGSGWGTAVRSIDEPLATIVTKQNLAIAEPTLEPCEQGAEVDPRRLVMVEGKPYLLDIRFRMLNNRELARAMGLPDGERKYEFAGTSTEITKQIGNMVEVNTAMALVLAILGDLGGEP